MSLATRILDMATGGGFTRAFANPRPAASDEDILNLYRGRYNQYATPEALRDVERGLQQYLSGNWVFSPTLDGIRDSALIRRGLKYNQSFDEIPEKSPTSRIMREIINHPDFSEYGA